MSQQQYRLLDYIALDISVLPKSIEFFFPPTFKSLKNQLIINNITNYINRKRIREFIQTQD